MSSESGTSSSSSSSFGLLKKRSSNDSESGTIETIVSHLIDEIIETIELQSLENEQAEQNVNNPAAAGTTVNNSINQQYLIDSCLTGLKHLCHTFARTHVFQASEDGDKDKGSDEIGRSFASLFGDTNLTEWAEAANRVYTIRLRLDCLAYLHSFQILNKLLIKTLFFPRETPVVRSSGAAALSGVASLTVCQETSDEPDRLLGTLVAEFEDWIKDLFVISCSSFIPSLNHGKISLFLLLLYYSAR